MGWTLNYEMFFYVLFFIGMWICHKKRLLITSIIIIFFAGVWTVIPESFFEMRYYTNPYMLEFVLGMLSFPVIDWLRRKYKKIQNSHNEIRMGIICDGIAILFSISAIVYMAYDFGKGAPLNWRWLNLGLPAWIFFISLMVVFGSARLPRVLVKLGNMTFSVYLIEYFTTALYKMLVPQVLMYGTVLGFVGLVITTFACSWVSYNIIEVRFTQWLMKHMIRG